MTESNWQICEKQPRLSDMVDRVLEKNRMGHAYILEGVEGSGPIDLAQYMAAYLLCETKDTNGAPCGECRICQRILNGEYADIIRIQPEENGLKIDQIRELKQQLGISPMEGDYKFFIIEAAETMTNSAANSLLKFIEEPHPNVIVFLVTPNASVLLPTIRSRCQTIHFPPIHPVQFEQALMADGMSEDLAHLLRHLTNDLVEAKAIAQDEAFQKQVEQMNKWLGYLILHDPRAFTMVQTHLHKKSDSRAEDRQLVRQGLDLLLFMAHDLLYLLLQEDGQIPQQLMADALVFPRFMVNYAKWLPRTSQTDMIKGIHAIHRAQQMIQHQVNEQAAMEYFVLAWWKKADSPS